MNTFHKDILAGIPAILPEPKPYDTTISHAPKRKEILSAEEKVLAIRNALRYFPQEHHAVLAAEFAQELKEYGRIYMYRFRPDYEMYARPIDEYPAKSKQAAAIMAMIQNNLDYRVAQHPHELITYGGNGAVFQNWAQYRLVMQYLATMTDEQTLVMYSGHPLGLFPSHKDAPRVIVTNGMVIPNYSKPDHWEKFNALGVSQYGQMTAGSYMYIGPQGIVHGTTITVMNAARKQLKARGLAGTEENMKGMLFVTAGLGGMSGAQPKAGVISGVVSVCAEVNPHAAHKRHSQGWVDEIHTDLDELIPRIRKAVENKEVVSIAYQGNVVDLWERLAEENVHVDLGSDQTSLHNPWAGGYYPVGYSYEESNRMMAEEPEKFRECVQESLRRHAAAVNKLADKGMYFFDYGNAFLLEASRAGADVLREDGRFRYPSYVQDIMGPLFFDYGFGPFRWVCMSEDPEDLAKSDAIAAKVLREIMAQAPEEIQGGIGENRFKELRRSRLCGYILLTVNLALSAAVLMILYQNKGYEYHGILIYIMAAYTFYVTTVAIVNLVKYRKLGSPVMSMTKIISMAAALVSMLSLETAMLSEFGKDMSTENKQIFIMLTGAGVSIIIVAMSVYSIVKNSKEIKQIMENDTYGE